ncbi:MAG: BatD family protein [Epsilonproteobacteria bacterium]|nr:BatD family protein [Campylobacterota bacterium]
MKRNLGRVTICIIFFLLTPLLASEYEWSAEANKFKAKTGEAIYLRYECRFVDMGELYTIEFNPPKESPEYRLYRLSAERSLKEGKRINSYEYLLFAKKSGKILLDFDVTMKKTNKDSIENTVLGRDNAQYEEFSKKIIKQKPLAFEIEDSHAALVGDFTISVEDSNKTLEAFTPYQLKIKIEGVGNLQDIEPFEYAPKGVKVFASEPLKEYSLTKDGYVGKFEQQIAFVSQNSFDLEAKALEYLSLKDGVKKSLLVEAAHIELHPAKVQKTLQKIDSPHKSIQPNGYLYHAALAVSFLLGLLTCYLFKKREGGKTDSFESFSEKVQKSDDMKELAILLALEDAQRYKPIIEAMSDGRIKNLKEAKKAIFN